MGGGVAKPHTTQYEADAKASHRLLSAKRPPSYLDGRVGLCTRTHGIHLVVRAAAAMRKIFNTSIWSLKYERQMYAGVPILYHTPSIAHPVSLIPSG
jgi:hypothetical protein